MNVIVQSNEQLESIQNYISTNGYRFTSAYPIHLDQDMIFVIDENDKTVSYSSALAILEDSNNSIYSVNKFLDLKSREILSLHNIDKIENGSLKNKTIEKYQGTDQEKSLKSFLDLASKAYLYSPDLYRKLLTNDHFYHCKIDNIPPIGEEYFYKDFPGLTLGFFDDELLIGILQNTESDKLKFRYMSQNEVMQENIHPVNFTKENVIDFIKQYEIPSLTHLKFYSTIPLALHHDKEIRNALYEKILDISLTNTELLLENNPDILCSGLYPNASKYFVDLLVIFKDDEDKTLINDGLHYMNTQFSNEISHLCEHYDQLNYYCDHIKEYENILNYESKLPSYEEKNALKRTIFLSENSVKELFVDFENIKNRITKIEDNPFLAIKNKDELFELKESKEKLSYDIEQKNAKLLKNIIEYKEMNEKEILLNFKISEQEKDLTYRFDILYDVDIFGSKSLRLAMFPSLESNKTYLDLIKENQTIIKESHQKYADAKEKINISSCNVLGNSTSKNDLKSKIEVDL